MGIIKFIEFRKHQPSFTKFVQKKRILVDFCHIFLKSKIKKLDCAMIFGQWKMIHFKSEVCLNLLGRKAHWSIWHKSPQNMFFLYKTIIIWISQVKSVGKLASLSYRLSQFWSWLEMFVWKWVYFENICIRFRFAFVLAKSRHCNKCPFWKLC